MTATHDGRKHSYVACFLLGLLLTLEVGAGLGCAGAHCAVLTEGEKPVEASSSSDPAFKSTLPVEGKMPKLNAAEWIGTPALTPESLRNRVVLVDFWTYSCINCIRVTPYLNAWAAKYRDQGLIVLGVHTPEFGFEKRSENIREEMRRFDIRYPVAVDSDYRIWNAFGNQYWPAYYLVDRQGRIRYRQFGEGEYGKAEAAIQDLLAEAKSPGVDHTFVKPTASGVQAAPNASSLGSPETYVGYREATGLASPEYVQRNEIAEYSAPALHRNTWGLSGPWTISAESAELARAGGSISYRFVARDLHLVMAPSTSNDPVRFQVTLDGKPPGEDHGADIDSDGRGTMTGARLYQLTRQKNDVRERIFEIRFEGAGVKAYVFTFG